MSLVASRLISNPCVEWIMSQNIVQFQAGLSMSEFFERYGTEAQCESALTKARWPQGFVCPHCGARSAVSFRSHGKPGWQCRECDKQTTLTAGTIFHSTKLPLRVWFQAMFVLTQAKNNVAALELKRILGVSYPTAWLIKHKLMEVMSERESTRKLDGLVQVDDAYLGGKHPGGKRGRGSENKTAFVAAVQTRDGRPQFMRLDPVEGFTAKSIREWALKALTPEAQAISDGLYTFRELATACAGHQGITTTGENRPAALATFKWINTLLGNVKTALAGTHHAFDFSKYGYRYLAECQYRFNRRFDLPAMLPRLLRATALTKPHSLRKIRLPENSC